MLDGATDIKNEGLKSWVDDWSHSASRSAVHWCDGSEHENAALIAEHGRRSGTLIKLDPAKRPRSYLCRSDPRDVARVENRTFICTDAARTTPARPTTGSSPSEMKARLRRLFDGCMRGRTMYVIPFSMGPLGSPIAHIGVQLTDSPYVVVSMRIMTRMGERGARRARRRRTSSAACTRSARRSRPASRTCLALQPGAEVHRRTSPRSAPIWSFGSGYGGNALLGKKCFALRIASVHGPRRGLAGRAHADPRRESPAGRARPTSRRRSPAPAARPTSRC